MSETLKEKTAKGLFWGGLNNGVQQAVGLVFGIILARLLSPSDYGMMAMLSVFSLIATTLQNSGFTTALANKREPRDEDYNSVFWFNIVVGISAYLILFACAPLIASYYHTDKLVWLCRYAFLSVVIASFGTAQNAWLFKNLRAKQQAKAAMTAVVASSVTGAACAFCGLAYWSLATQGLVYVLVNTVMAWHYSHWRPTARHVSLAPVREMFRFSCKILVSNIANNINNNILNFLLGHYFTPHDTGNYNQAYQWDSKAFMLIQGMLGQVAQPVLVGLGDERARQMAALRKLVRFAAFIGFPLLLGFGMVAKEFITLAIGQKWIVSAGYIQTLCVAGATMPIFTVLSNMVVSRGRSGLYLAATAGLGVVQIVAMMTLWRHGIQTMVVAYTVINVAWIFVWHGMVWRLTGYGLVTFLKDTLPFALAAAAVMAVTHFATLSIANLWLLLASRVAMAASLYYVVMRLAGAEILAECQSFVMRKRK